MRKILTISLLAITIGLLVIPNTMLADQPPEDFDPQMVVTCDEKEPEDEFYWCAYYDPPKPIECWVIPNPIPQEVWLLGGYNGQDANHVYFTATTFGDGFVADDNGTYNLAVPREDILELFE